MSAKMTKCWWKNSFEAPKSSNCSSPKSQFSLGYGVVADEETGELYDNAEVDEKIHKENFRVRSERRGTFL